MTVVCGVDGSSAARDVVSAAATLAAALGHRLVLVHVVDRTMVPGHPTRAYALDPYAAAGQSSQEPLEKAGKRILEGLVDVLKLDPSTTLRVEAGDPSHVLVDIAEAQRAELIVVGTRGRGRLATALLGSTSEAVVSLSACPVLVVPSGAHVGSGTLVCGVDDSSDARNAARVARVLANGLGVGVVLVHAAPTAFSPGISAAPGGLAEVAEAEQREAEEFLARLARDEGFGDDVERRVAFGSQADAIRGIADEVGAALVVVGTRRRGALRSALAGSVSLDLKEDASRPVLIVPARARLPLRT